MENASKALIIAGAILIALLVISLGIFEFKKMSDTVDKNANLNKQEIVAFNSKISPYIGNNISGSQVNELIQRAISINQKAENEGDTVKRIKINDNFDNITRFATGKYYNVEGQYDSNGLLTIIKIETNSEEE